MDPRYGGALWRGLSICLGHYTLDIPSGTLFHVREGTPGWLRGFGPGRGCFHVRRRRFSSKLGNPYRNPITDISDLENCPSQPLQPTPKKNLQGRTHDPRIRSLTGRGGELCGQCAGCVRDAELHELVNGRDLATGFSMLSDDVFFFWVGAQKLGEFCDVFELIPPKKVGELWGLTESDDSDSPEFI